MESVETWTPLSGSFIGLSAKDHIRFAVEFMLQGHPQDVLEQISDFIGSGKKRKVSTLLDLGTGIGFSGKNIRPPPEKWTPDVR